MIFQYCAPSLRTGGPDPLERPDGESEMTIGPIFGGAIIGARFPALSRRVATPRRAQYTGRSFELQRLSKVA